MFKRILKFIFCDLLHIHRYKNEMSAGLYAEGWDKFYMCKYCKKTKGKFMNGVNYEL